MSKSDYCYILVTWILKWYQTKIINLAVMWRIQFCAIYLRSIILSLSQSLSFTFYVCDITIPYIRYYSIARLKRKEILTLSNIDLGIDIDSLEILCSRYGRYLLLVDGTFYIHSYEIYCCSRTSKIALKTQFSHNSSSEQDMHKMW